MWYRGRSLESRWPWNTTTLSPSSPGQAFFSSISREGINSFLSQLVPQGLTTALTAILVYLRHQETRDAVVFYQVSKIFHHNWEKWLQMMKISSFFCSKILQLYISFCINVTKRGGILGINIVDTMKCSIINMNSAGFQISYNLKFNYDLPKQRPRKYLLKSTKNWIYKIHH